MVNLPVWLLLVLFTLSLYLTVPLPAPLAPETTVIHPALLTAVQEHPDCELRLSPAFPPGQPAVMDCEDIDVAPGTDELKRTEGKDSTAAQKNAGL